MAATEAGPDPLTAPQNRQTTVPTTPMPPGRLPMSTRKNRIIRSAMPSEPMSVPARMKKGIARSENLVMPAVMRSPTRSRPKPSVHMA